MDTNEHKKTQNTKLQCRYKSKKDLSVQCPGIPNQRYKSGYKVYYICPICNRKNLWVFTAVNGKEIGHLSAIGPKSSRGMKIWSIRLEDKTIEKLNQYDDELVRVYLDNMDKL